MSIAIWCCDNCGYPLLIEDGGFAPDLETISGTEAGRRWGAKPPIVDCDLCGNQDFIKVEYEPKIVAQAQLDAEEADRIVSP